MRIANEFTVGAPPDAVYQTLLDFERVGACIPGATVGAAADDGSHPAEIAVRLGPMRLTYRGTVRLEDRDLRARRAVLVADVREVRGQGKARARMSVTVAEAPTGAHVGSTTEVELTGRAAQMGAGIVEDVAERLITDMAGNLERLLDHVQNDATLDEALPDGQGNEAPLASGNRPIGGLRLLLRALWHRLWRGRRHSLRETH